ncbi:MAG TPA: hypothetical protein VM553_08825 [Dongiaceae bacterium]|nr:hypothetical protein [Dongiaceae bacterium]
MTRFLFCFSLTAALLTSGCAIHDARHEQCARPDFLSCLDVKYEQCDNMFDKGLTECRAKMEANTVFATMPDNMKESYTNRCVLDSMVTQSGKESDEVKNCIRW